MQSFSQKARQQRRGTDRIPKFCISSVTVILAKSKEATQTKSQAWTRNDIEPREMLQGQREKNSSEKLQLKSHPGNGKSKSLHLPSKLPQEITGRRICAFWDPMKYSSCRSEQARNACQDGTWCFPCLILTGTAVEQRHLTGTMSQVTTDLISVLICLYQQIKTCRKATSSAEQIHLDRQCMGISWGQSSPGLDGCFHFWVWRK